MKRTERYETGDRWLSLEIELRGEDGAPELSISGATGSIISEGEARVAALASWRDFCADNPGELGELVKRFPGEGIDSPEQAARFIVKTDGPLHGLDVDRQESGRVYLVESCGQMIEDVIGFDAERGPAIVALWRRWHLNGLRPGCEHQRAGWRGYECPNGHKWAAETVLSVTTPNLSGETRPPCPTCGEAVKFGSPAWPDPQKKIVTRKWSIGWDDHRALERQEEKDRAAFGMDPQPGEGRRPFGSLPSNAWGPATPTAAEEFRRGSEAARLLWLLKGAGIRPFSWAALSPAAVAVLERDFLPVAEHEIKAYRRAASTLIFTWKGVTYDARGFRKPRPPLLYRDETGSAGHTRPDEHPDGILCKPCPVCGYRYGSEWRKEALPEDVIRWAREGGPVPAVTP